jgi:hypothetical protein
VHALADGCWFDLQERAFYKPKKVIEKVTA